MNHVHLHPYDSSVPCITHGAVARVEPGKSNVKNSQQRIILWTYLSWEGATGWVAVSELSNWHFVSWSLQCGAPWDRPEPDMRGHSGWHETHLWWRCATDRFQSVKATFKYWLGLTPLLCDSKLTIFRFWTVTQRKLATWHHRGL